MLACLVLIGGSASTALAQVAPDDADPTPPPDEHPMGTDERSSDPTYPGTTGTYPPGTTPAPSTTTAPAPIVEASPPPVVIAPPPAEPDDTEVIVVQPERESWRKTYGAALSLGGGVSQFTDSGMRDATGMAGFWDLRGHFGLHSPLALEIAYIGSASEANPRLGPARSATLLGNGVEAVARFNLITDSIVQPYLFGGAAWKHYEVAGEDFSTSATGMSDADDVLEIPVGAGLSYRLSGLFADARFTFRGAAGEDLVIGTPDDTPTDDFLSDDDNYLPLHNWQAGARIGYEF